MEEGGGTAVVFPTLWALEGAGSICRPGLGLFLPGFGLVPPTLGLAVMGLSCDVLIVVVMVVDDDVPPYRPSPRPSIFT